MKIFMSDMYRVECRYPLDDLQRDILYYLYQPLIGSDPVHLYMNLYLESKRMERYLQPCSLSRLVSCLSVSLIDIEKALLKLEGIGLLKSYKKTDKDITLYLFHLRNPLSLDAFIKHPILSALLQETLSEEDLKKTIEYFRGSSMSLKDFEDVTVKFKDVYHISHGLQNGKMLHYNDLKEKHYHKIEIDYDVDMLYKALSDQGVSRIKLSDEDIKYASSLALVYSIDPLTLALHIKDSLTSKGLNKEELKTRIKNYYNIDSITKLDEVYHKQPVLYKTNTNESSILIDHMRYLDSITPYELLKSKQGGKEPVFYDLKIVESLMLQLGLNPAVINVLIEYVLGKCDNKLIKGYCESVGATLKRKNVLTALDAYKVLMDEGTTEKEPQKSVTIERSETFDESKIHELLSQLED